MVDTFRDPKDRTRRGDERLWFERETQTFGEFYTPEDTVAIKRAMLGDVDSWVDTIAEGKGTTRQVYYPTYDYGPTTTDNFHARTDGITHAAHEGEHPTSFNQLDRGQTLQVEAAWRNMKFKNDGMNYWDVQTYTTPDGVTHRDLTPKAMSMWNIENDGEKWGWNDVMIGELQRRLTEDIPKAPGFADADQSQIFEVPRSGGGGSRGPVYVEPMRSVIEDTVKAMLTSLTGDEPDARVQELTDEYLKADRARFKIGQEGGVDIVPNQIVLDKIRQQDDYQRIHKLRAESDSETGWIGVRNQRLQQLGLGSGDADERAVQLAQTGTNLNDIDIGAFQNSKGIKDITLMSKIKKAASDVAGLL